jgi:hypothetical protein
MTIAGRFRFKASDLFTLFIIVMIATALIIASEWTLRASVLILVLGSAGLVLAIAQLFVDTFYRAPDKPVTGPQYDVPSFDDADPKLMTKSTLEIWLWLVGLVCAIPLMGMPVALTLFVLAYCKIYGGSWLVSLFSAGLVALFIWGIYIHLMHVYWPDSLLGRYIDGI